MMRGHMRRTLLAQLRPQWSVEQQGSCNFMKIGFAIIREEMAPDVEEFAELNGCFAQHDTSASQRIEHAHRDDVSLIDAWDIEVDDASSIDVAEHLAVIGRATIGLCEAPPTVIAPYLDSEPNAPPHPALSEATGERTGNEIHQLKVGDLEPTQPLGKRWDARHGWSTIEPIIEPTHGLCRSTLSPDPLAQRALLTRQRISHKTDRNDRACVARRGVYRGSMVDGMAGWGAAGGGGQWKMVGLHAQRAHILHQRLSVQEHQTVGRIGVAEQLPAGGRQWIHRP